jgi:hypothetical protein
VHGTGEVCIMQSLRYLLLTKFYSGDQIKENVMAGACGTYRER